MAYILDHDWKISADPSWLKGRKWGTTRFGYVRADAVRLWLTAEQDDALVGIEAMVVAAVATACTRLRSAYPRVSDKWSDKTAQALMLALRTEFDAAGVPPGSSTFVACDRAVAKFLQTARGQHKRLLPIQIPAGRVVTLRLAAGLAVDAPLARGMTEGRPSWALGALGYVLPEPPVVVPDIEAVRFVEVGRYGSNWWARLVRSAENSGKRE